MILEVIQKEEELAGLNIAHRGSAGDGGSNCVNKELGLDAVGSNRTDKVGMINIWGVIFSFLTL